MKATRLLSVVAFGMGATLAIFVLAGWLSPFIKALVVGVFIDDQNTLARIALEDEHQYVRRAAVEKLTDQTAIAKVAVKNRDELVHHMTMWKLTDQTAIAEVAMESEDAYVRLCAVRKLTDRNALAKIALEEKKSLVIDTAVAAIGDQATLAMIALEGGMDARSAAVPKLNQPRLIEYAAATDDQETSRTIDIILRVLSACETLPAEHKTRLTCHILDIVHALNQREVRGEVGDLVGIAAIWSHDGASYGGRVYVPGESFTVFIAYSKRKSVFCEDWASSFSATIWAAPSGPHETLPFHRANVKSEDLVKKVIDNQVGHRRFHIGLIGKLTDQSLLARIALEDADESICQAANQRIAELRKIAGR